MCVVCLYARACMKYDTDQCRYTFEFIAVCVGVGVGAVCLSVWCFVWVVLVCVGCFGGTVFYVCIE